MWTSRMCVHTTDTYVILQKSRRNEVYQYKGINVNSPTTEISSAHYNTEERSTELQTNHKIQMSSLSSFAATFKPPSSLKRLVLSNRTNSYCRYPSLNRLCRFSIRCSYAGTNIKEDYTSAPIDVVADVKTERVVVLGGSGFVGSAICKAAVSKGIEVVSLSRTGRPSYSDSWVNQVTWMAGDVFYAK
uniref:NAD-dependent epimerase/dehydratase domain-containing protein n=1 Tax=Nelumbo nucifera TaxID=4432 RepID=A0A822XCH9_NELNU|nr:TPA_asm: hypothetical protein HUJ06_019340 [Nelumbo nucifera]